MTDLVAQCKKLYGTKDVYKIFGIANGVSKENLKKAYYKISLKVHPDKVTEEDKSKSTEKFKLISKLYTLLCDDKTRQEYEKTGELSSDEDLGLSDNRDWQEYWRALFPSVTVKAIEEFQKKYKGSNQELLDLKEAYVTSKGNMQKIIDSILCASYEDEERLRNILMPLVESKELPTYKAFTSESATSKQRRQSKALKEAAEAQKAAKDLKGGSLEGYDDLAVALKQNKEKRSGIISYIEEKYCNLENEEDDLVIISKKAKKRRAESSQSKPKPKRKKQK